MANETPAVLLNLREGQTVLQGQSEQEAPREPQSGAKVSTQGQDEALAGDSKAAFGQRTPGRALKVLVPSCTDQFLNVCLASMERSQPGSTVHVVVGDNGISEALKQKYPQVTFITIPKPFVFARAINLMAQAAGQFHKQLREDQVMEYIGPDLLVLNDDCEVESIHWHHWVQQALMLPTHQQYGMLSLEINGGVGNDEQKITHKGPDDLTEVQKPLMFVAVVIRNECWQEVGPLDEQFVGYGFDDNDYNIRVKAKGWKCGVMGAAKVKHGMAGYPHSSTYARVNDQAQWNRMYEMNGRLLKHKYGLESVKNRLCLNIGCGDTPKADEQLDRWLNMDIQAFQGVQIVRDLRRGIPVPDECFDHVLCDNVLEHFNSEDVIFIINEIDRVLKVGGTAEIIVPHSLVGQGAYQDPTHKSYFVPRSVLYWNQEMSARGGRFVGITANLLPHPDVEKGVQVYGDQSHTEEFIRFILIKKAWNNPNPVLTF
jgi:SAM-dependent methyltransferase